LLGCDATQAARQQDRDAVTESAACFDVSAPYEVTALGRKLVGSAQVRRRGVVLQHGSLPLTGDVSRLANVLSLSAHGRQELCEKLCRRAIALDEALGRAVSWAEAAAALAEGFIEALNLRLEPGGLSAGEQAEVDRQQALYAGDEWMFGSS
jgi:lipoate-protein ligase A